MKNLINLDFDKLEAYCGAREPSKEPNCAITSAAVTITDSEGICAGRLGVGEIGAAGGEESDDDRRSTSFIATNAAEI